MLRDGRRAQTRRAVGRQWRVRAGVCDGRASRFCTLTGLVVASSLDPTRRGFFQAYIRRFDKDLMPEIDRQFGL